jgi:hypothetical protein
VAPPARTLNPPTLNAATNAQPRYDEHGGFADHAKTPTAGVPSPDGIKASNGFDFDRLGVRVPTVAVSPRIPRGTVVHAPTGARAPTPTSQFDATSTISTANKIFGIAGAMTARDAWAGHFEDIVAGPARRDTPVLRRPAPLPAEVRAAEAAMPLADHHLESLNMLCAPDFAVAAAHPACAAHGDAAAQAAWVAALEGEQGGSGGAPWSAQLAAAYPNLLGAGARLLRQEHFGDAIGALFGAYKAAKGV